MERSKLAFIVAATALVLGGTFTAGLYSAYKENLAFRSIFGVWDDAKTLIREIPNLTGSAPIRFLRPAMYPGQGVTINLPEAGADDLILLSGFLKDDNKVQLIRRDGTIVNEWRLRAHELFADPTQCRKPPATNWNAITHGTIANPQGDIVFSFESCGMIRLDRCGKAVWPASKELTHHSPNWTEDGGVVIAGSYRVEPGDSEVIWPFQPPFWEDSLMQYDPSGKLIANLPLTKLFAENGMAAQLTAGNSGDTWIGGEFHFNDVQQLSTALAPDFPMFVAGDLLMSVRNLNLLMVTDAEVKKIKWFKTGPWIRQHDPDFQPGGTITMFDNHMDATPDGSRNGGSRIWQVDPATDVATVLYGGTPAQHMYSPERGTHQMLPGGGIMITEAEQGRSFQVTPDGKIVWEYVNRWDDKQITWIHDAEVYPADYFKVSDWSCN